jgi:polyhydroxybutyrate depolymerase
MRRSLLVLLSSLAFVVEAEAAGTTPVQRDWKVDGVVRQALVAVPPRATLELSPVVFAFHGHGGTMRSASRGFAYHELWPEAIVVTMQGLPTPGALTDPEGKLPGWQKSVGDQNDRDLKFFDAVLASLRADYKVDDRRIYATGHSNGGAFTYLLWGARGDVFAAVAPSAAGPGRGLRDLKPKPALHVAGETDKLVPYAMQKRVMQAVRKLNGCDEAESKPWAKEGSLVATLYPSKTGTPFVSAIDPGGHKAPKEAPALIVRFFKEHTKP